MKIAVCLSGMPRNIENSYTWLKESILDVLDANNINWDIFISTWNNDDTNHLHKKFKPEVINIGTYNSETEKHLGWDKFKEHKFEIEPRVSCLAQFDRIYTCNNVRKEHEKKNNIQYDIIIRTRTELKFNNRLDIKELDIIKNCESPVIFLRQGPNPQNIHWYKDNFAIMNRAGVDIYSDCINHLLSISKLTQVSTAELILRNWLDLNKNLLVKHTSLDYTLTRN